PISRATSMKPPIWVLVPASSAMAAAPLMAPMRLKDSIVVGTGENVLVSCIIMPITIFRRAIGCSGATRQGGCKWLIRRDVGDSWRRRQMRNSHDHHAFLCCVAKMQHYHLRWTVA